MDRELWFYGRTDCDHYWFYYVGVEVIDGHERYSFSDGDVSGEYIRQTIRRNDGVVFANSEPKVRGYPVVLNVANRVVVIRDGVEIPLDDFLPRIDQT